MTFARAFARIVATLTSWPGVGQLDLEIHDAAARDHTLLDHRTNRHRVDVAARHDRDDDVLSRRLRELARTQIEMFERGERNGTCGLYDHLVLLEHEQDHLVDIALGDLHKVVEELIEQREREIAGTTHRHASADVTTLSAGTT